MTTFGSFTINGGVAQSGRAVGSYPACHRFKSCPRYQILSLTKFGVLNKAKIFQRIFWPRLFRATIPFSAGIP